MEGRCGRTHKGRKINVTMSSSFWLPIAFVGTCGVDWHTGNGLSVWSWGWHPEAEGSNQNLGD